MKPLLKWAGGKSQILSELVPHFPVKKRYVEPFLGGGSMFFHLHEINKFDSAILADINPHLINFYNQIKDNPDAVVEKAQALSIDEKTYYNLRANIPSDKVDQAVRFLYINKCGFNGLYRENKKGECNVPWGKVKQKVLIDYHHATEVSAALQNAQIICDDFNNVLANADLDEDTLVYCDPPYLPFSNTAKFTQYCKSGFGLDKHKELAVWLNKACDNHVAMFISNSYTDVTFEIFEGWRYETVMAKRSINSKGGKRGCIPELFIISERKAMLI